MKALIAFLVILVGVLQYQLWFAPGGLLETYHVRHSFEQQTAENDRLRARNSIMEADIKDLQTGNDSIERHARKNMGMIKKDETFYQVVS